MPRTVLVLILSAAMLTTVGLASTNSVTGGTGSSPSIRWTPMSSPAPAVQAPAAGNAGPTTIHWDKFYDRSGNLLPGEPGDAVGADSLYWKLYTSTANLYSSPKAQNVTPAQPTSFSWQYNQSVPGMTPDGHYMFEVSGTNMRRTDLSTGAADNYTLANAGEGTCGTDGQYVYVPNGTTTRKYSLNGILVSTTTMNYAPLYGYGFGVANDTVWLTPDDVGTTWYGYACSKFTGGSITHDATWATVGGEHTAMTVAYDGRYYYMVWGGYGSNTLLRFYHDRTLYTTGTVTGDPRGVMCSAQYKRQVTQDSLYWKLHSSTANLYSSPKAQNVTAAQPTPFSWQYDQSVPCMTPDGHYMFEVSGTNMRRTDLMTGAVENYTLANASGGACGTDGQYVYVPNGTTTRKYSLTGTLVSTTTTDYAPWVGMSTFGFGVANDTVWLTPAHEGTTWYGYACSKFTGGSITHDATWATGGGSASAMSVASDGQYYYMAFGGFGSNTFLRFHRDRTLYSTGTVTGDARSVMCKALCPLMIVSTDAEGYRVELAETLKVASGGILNSIGTYDVGTNVTFPATDWYNAGCRVIFEFSGSPLPNNPTLVGESLAKFVDLGGRVVTAMWADNTGNLDGRYVTQYMPFTMQTQPMVGGTMGTVHDPLHPIMDGVSSISVTDYITGNTHSTLRSSNCVCLAEWDSGNRSVAACLDSADVRLASVGFVPFKTYSGATGQWAKLLVNAILWVWPGMPAVTVTAPDTGDVWYVGTSQDIIWTAANGPITRDSIVYSYDNGVTWNFLDKYTGSRTSYAWNPIPNTPDSNCYVRVFSWNAVGSAGGTSGRFEIQPAGGIAQPENNALPLAFALYQSYPNPLATGAQLRYALPRPAQVELRIYDVAGTLVRRLVDGVQPAGYRRAYWNGLDDRGRSVAPGVYYCRFQAGDFTAAQKLVVRR